MTLWPGAELAAALGVAEAADATGVSIDTRTLQPGDVFFAIRGVASDGHDHVAAALAAGASAAVVREGFAGDGPLLRVTDTQAALEALGRAARARSTGQIAAVTGSVGKTTTKEMLRLMLPAHASEKSYNNLWGVPLSLARLPAEAPFGVFEIGMNHPGEITPLVKLVAPHAAIITTVAPVHLASFANVEAIADAKAEIFSGLQPGGAAILPADNAHFSRLAAAGRAAYATVLGFGRSGKAGRLLSARADGETAQHITADILGTVVAFRLPAPGDHLAANAVAALTAVAALDGDLKGAAARLEQFSPPEGRGVRRHIALPGGGQATLIDESYNANPASMRAALGVLALAPGRRVAVLGDMLELGETAPALHAALAAEIDAAGIDVVYACGPLSRFIADLVPPARRGGWAQDATALAPMVLAALRPGDTVMVKGSAGSRMGAVVSAIARLAPGRG